MTKKVKVLIILGVTFVTLFIGLVIFFNATPAGRTVWNNWQSTLQVADDKSEYETKKDVEDTCRAMIALYKNDANTYRIYKDAETEYYRSIAEDARIRANQTVSTYNEYILKNKYVWKDNVPSDIALELEYI